MMWDAAPVLIVVACAWPLIVRFLGFIRSARSEPGARTDDPVTRRLATVNFDDLRPPQDLHTSEPWDQYWRTQYDSGMYAFGEMFVDDRRLLEVIEARGWSCGRGVPGVTILVALPGRSEREL